MKKLLLALLMVAILAVTAHAKTFTVEEPKMEDTSGNLLSGTRDMGLGTVVYTKPVPVINNVGFATFLVTESQAGGTGDMDISVEYSIDGVNFYTPYKTDMAGTVTADGNLITTLSNSTRWIYFAPRLAKFMRFKFDPDATSTITATLIYQEQR